MLHAIRRIINDLGRVLFVTEVFKLCVLHFVEWLSIFFYECLQLFLSTESSLIL
jgi:hypothetical protein